MRSVKAPPLPAISRVPCEHMPPPTPQDHHRELTSGTFTFINDERNIGWPPNWEQAKAPLLWQFNLHYFDWLWSVDYHQAEIVVTDWIDRYPLAHERVGWAAYPTSLRLMNWICILLGRFYNEVQEAPEFRERLWQSTYLQAEWLRKHLETHIQANHLLENAIALTLAGATFDGQVATEWIDQGTKLLTGELKEQFLADGMHYERSPMYHQRMLYGLLLLQSLGNDAVSALTAPILEPACTALRHLLHPDGNMALFNDSAFKIYTAPAPLLDAAAQVSERSPNVCTDRTGAWALPDAGYYGFRAADNTYIVCDAGPIGPDHQPGHGHGDMLSFELSIKGQRVVVDSGVLDYGCGETRAYCRSTRAHNTVEFEGQDQCEFWSDFRVARRGRVHDVEWSPSETGFVLSAWHDGYARLRGSHRHSRSFKWAEPGTLTIDDQLTGNAPFHAVSRIHFHPDCTVDVISKQEARVQCSSGVLKISCNGPGVLSTEPSTYCPEFGKAIENVCLCHTVDAPSGDTHLQWLLTSA